MTVVLRFTYLLLIALVLSLLSQIINSQSQFASGTFVYCSLRFQVALDKHMKLMDSETKHVETHQVTFDKDLAEVMSLLRTHSEKLHRKQLTRKDGSFDKDQHDQVSFHS